MDDPFESRSSGHRGRMVDWCGHCLVELESRELRLRISSNRGAEIQQLLHKPTDTELMWSGHPAIVRNEVAPPSVNRVEGNFLDHFSGGWQVVLPTAHSPTTYRGASFGQHGEAALLPWSIQVTCDDPERLEVVFTVELRNAPLLVERRIGLKGATVSVAERVTNLGSTAHDVQWGQHITFAGEALPAGTTLSVGGSPQIAVPQLSSPSYRFAPGITEWPTVRRVDGTHEDASLLGPDDGTDGHLIVGPLAVGEVLVRPPSHLPALTLSWDANVHPFCWFWEVLGGYDAWPLWGRHRLVAIEPFNVPVETLTESIEGGRATSIAPGATIANIFRLTAHTQELHEDSAR